jgi:hypothetical protein
MEVTFQQHPAVNVAGSAFIGVPVVLQFEETPLIEVVRIVNAGFTTRFPVYHGDGTKIAVVVGSRIFVTPEGKDAKVTLRQEPNLSVCELEGKPILELHRKGAAALRGVAELYAPKGVLVKANDAGVAAQFDKDLLTFNGKIHSNMFINVPFGFRITRDEVMLAGVFRWTRKQLDEIRSKEQGQAEGGGRKDESSI